MASSVATIHLDDLAHGGPAARDGAVSALGRSLVDTGFVKVDGHGIAAATVDAAYAAARELFALPDEAKLAYVQPKGAGGYTPYGTEHARDSPAADLKEYWHVHQEVAPDHPLFPTYGANVWPVEVPGLRSAALRLYRALEATAETLLEAIATYLGLPPRHLADMVVDGRSVLRLLHYPPRRDAAAPGAVRAAAHEDINLITLLPAASDAGLELLDREGRWHAVDGLEGELVVDAADMLSRHTNLLIPSTTHRVVDPVDVDRARYSMPFFCHPRPDVVLDAPPGLVGDGPRHFPPITADAYLDERLAEIGLA